MKRYWIVKVTSFDSGWEPVEIYASIAAEFTDEEIPALMDFVDASESFDFPQLQTTGISFSQLYAFVGNLDTTVLVNREHKGRKYYLIPVKPRP